MAIGNFEAIIEASKPAVLGAITRYITQPADRDDVAQVVYLKIYMLWQKKKLAGINKPSTYFYTLAKHETFKWNKTVVTADVLNEDLVYTENFEDEAALKAALDTLPEKYGSLLHYILQGFKLEEVGTLFRVNLNTVKTRLRRAKQHLTLALKEK